MSVRLTKRLWIVGVAIGGMAMVSGLAIVTRELSAAEQRHLELSRESIRDDMVREALWRMDGAMAPLLASESMRPPADYETFRSPGAAVNRMLQQVPEGEVLTPSPLLTTTPDWIRLHFQWSGDAGVTSPQVPQGNWRDLAEGVYLKGGVHERLAKELDVLRQALGADASVIDACAAVADAQRDQARVWQSAVALDRVTGETAKQLEESQPRPQTIGGGFGLVGADEAPSEERAGVGTKVSAVRGEGGASVPAPPSAAPASSALSDAEAVPPAQRRALEDYAARAQTLNDVQTGATAAFGVPVVVEASSTTQVGALVPVWMPDASPPLLVCLRRVIDEDGTVVQGFIVDWEALAPRLIAGVSDLMRGAELVPVTAVDSGFVSARMATLPVELRPDMVFAEQRVHEQPTARGAVLLAWTAGLGAIVIAVFAATAAVRFGERQARFASSVTHELRTPLTTFRLYSEMLRDGMVADEARLRECHETLVRESARLSHLVENVLSLARIERGAAPSHPMPQDLGATGWRSLIQAVLAESAAGARCTVDVPDDIGTVTVDLGTVTPILANLATNAAKYGASPDGVADIAVSLRLEGRSLIIEVADRGPGIPPAKRAAIWRAFDRAGADAGPHAGVGLGLPLARALAERASGSLTLCDSPIGARFELRLPLGA